MKYLICILVGLSLVNCAHRPSLDQRLQSHYGQNIDELMVKFGPPFQTQKLSDGKMLYVWRMQGAMTTRAEIIPFNFSGQRQLVSETPTCETQYLTDPQGIIISGSYRGQCR